MKIRFSKGMSKCLKDVQIEALSLLQHHPDPDIIKIKKKPTKKKELEFHILQIGKPIIRLFVNGRFYATYLYNGKKWNEER